MILDGGECQAGLESTIIDLSCDVPTLLRAGGLDLDAVTELIPDLRMAAVSEEIRSPGQLLRHYSPKIPLRLNATYPFPGEGFLTFGIYKGTLPEGTPVLHLSPAGNTSQAAACLFDYLHRLEEMPYIQGIAVMPIPETGLGIAIKDRLKRGAES